jgi:hypothetical protein
VGYIVWFEPERVAQGTYIDTNFPEYTLKQAAINTTRSGSKGNSLTSSSYNSLLNLGNPNAREYIYEYLTAAVEQYVIVTLA